MSNPHYPYSSSGVPPNRRTHRKRISALRLSSDTTSTLPEYIPTGAWSHTTTTTTTTTTGTGTSGIEGLPSTSRFVVNQGEDPSLDLPPDYPDSAEEADEDTDVDGDTTLDGNYYSRHSEFRQQQQQHEYVPQFTVYAGSHLHGLSRTAPGTKSPKRFRRYPSHRITRSVGSTASGKLPSIPPPSQSSRTSPLPSPTSDLFLDSLLERSVHALEMSNTLLQSSMNTRSSLSTLISAGAGSDSGSGLPPQSQVLGVAKRGSGSYNAVVSDEQYEALESRIKTWKNVRETWADDLDEIKRGVERLFGGGDVGASVDDTEVEVGRDSQSSRRRREHDRQARRSEDSISSSMPTESPLKQRSFSSYRHPDERPVSSTSVDVWSTNGQSMGEDDRGPGPQLRLEQQQRERLVARPPRALTQYVEANSDVDTIVLPSTLGLRSTSSSHRVVTTERRDVTTKGNAYNMLSSLASRSTGPAASTTSLPSSSSPTSPVRPRSRSNGNLPELRLPYLRRKSSSPLRSGPWVGFLGRSRSETPKPAVGRDCMANGLGPPRLMTPPIESLSSPSQSSSSSSSEDEEPFVDGQKRKRGPSAKRTVLELRRILDEQPSPLPSQPEAKFEIILRPPALLQKVGGSGTTAEAGTSNATASVSRLLTKNKHSSSARPPSPPRQSALKGRSVPGTPTTPATPPASFAVEAAVHAAQATAKPPSDSSPGSSAFRIPEVFTSFVAKSAFLAKGKGKAENPKGALLSPPTLSPSGSGASTPKRISFAELPESYSGGHGQRGSSRKSKSRHGRKRSLSDSDEVEDGGWFGWLIGGGVSASRHDRMEDRYDRPWSNGPGSARLMGGGVYSSGMDDWAV
ncbi:hypothetical protein L218DRAFT_968287 [Marasmius fiardii PR-910]|nr:hypothetical protein L218DRAFT_968287 [Marasmius fiardii PR-910]